MAFGDADASTPAFVSVNSNWTTVGATSGLFTPPSGSLVVLFVYGDTSSGANPGNETVTDTIDGATGWTFQIRRAKPDSGSQAGTVAWWEKVYASAPVAPIAVTVVGNATGAASGGFKTHVVAGCSSSEGRAEGSNTAAAVSLAITSTTNNARGVVAATDWNVQANMTAGTSQTALLASSVGSGPDTRVYLGIRNAVTSPAGSVTMSTASPTSGNANNFIGGFFVPAAGGATVTGVAAATLGACTAAGAGARVIGGTTAASLGGAAATITGLRTVSGVAVATLGGAGAIAAGLRKVNGVSASALGGLTGHADAGGSKSGTAAATLGTLTGTAVGVRTVSGAAVAALGRVAAPAVAVRVVFGSPSAALGGVVAAAVPRELGLLGTVHGPLPVAIGAITVHTYGIAGAVT